MAARLTSDLYHKGEKNEWQTIKLEGGPLHGKEWEVRSGVLGVYLPDGKKTAHYRLRDGKWVYEPRQAQ